jgi:hypothetical protein
LRSLLDPEIALASLLDRSSTVAPGPCARRSCRSSNQTTPASSKERARLCAMSAAQRTFLSAMPRRRCRSSGYTVLGRHLRTPARSTSTRVANRHARRQPFVLARLFPHRHCAHAAMAGAGIAGFGLDATCWMASSSALSARAFAFAASVEVWSCVSVKNLKPRAFIAAVG